jgi:hypothetical protein
MRISVFLHFPYCTLYGGDGTKGGGTEFFAIAVARAVCRQVDPKKELDPPVSSAIKSTTRRHKPGGPTLVPKPQEDVAVDVVVMVSPATWCRRHTRLQVFVNAPGR